LKFEHTNVSPKALCLAEDIAACLVEKLNMVLLNKIPKVQVSDTTGDAMKTKAGIIKILSGRQAGF